MWQSLTLLQQAVMEAMFNLVFVLPVMAMHTNHGKCNNYIFLQPILPAITSLLQLLQLPGIFMMITFNDSILTQGSLLEALKCTMKCVCMRSLSLQSIPCPLKCILTMEVMETFPDCYIFKTLNGINGQICGLLQHSRTLYRF